MYTAAATRAELREFVPFMHRLIGAAFGVIRPLFLTGTAVIDKADASPVTQADRGAEQALRALIERHYPDHAILGEEFGEKAGAMRGTRYRWVLDPVDGTRAFITNCFLFGTLIALERWQDDERGAGWRPLLGCIAHPAAGQALIGHAGGCTLYAADGSQRTTRVRTCARIEDATLLATSLWTVGEQRHAPNVDRIERLAQRPADPHLGRLLRLLRARHRRRRPDARPDARVLGCGGDRAGDRRCRWTRQQLDRRRSAGHAVADRHRRAPARHGAGNPARPGDAALACRRTHGARGDTRQLA